MLINTRVAVALTLLGLFLVGMFFLGTFLFKTFALSTTTAATTNTTANTTKVVLHQVNRSYIPFLQKVKFAAQMRYGMDSGGADIIGARIRLLDCINFATNESASMNALDKWNNLYKCDQDMTQDYAAGGLLSPLVLKSETNSTLIESHSKLPGNLGVSNHVQYWDELAKRYLQARGILQ